MRRKSTSKQEIERDTIGYMPERFSTGYFQLVRLGLNVDPHAQVFDNESSTQKKKYHTHGGGLRDESALRFKAWVDRQLRAIGRDIQAYLNARDSSGPSPIGMSPEARRAIARDLERKTELKCRGCQKYVSWQWRHCPWCGRELIHGEAVPDRSDDESGGSTSEPQIAVGPLFQLSRRTRTDSDGADGAEARSDDDGEEPKG